MFLFINFFPHTFAFFTFIYFPYSFIYLFVYFHNYLFIHLCMFIYFHIYLFLFTIIYSFICFFIYFHIFSTLFILTCDFIYSLFLVTWFLQDWFIFTLLLHISFFTCDFLGTNYWFSPEFLNIYVYFHMTFFEWMSFIVIHNFDRIKLSFFSHVRFFTSHYFLMWVFIQWIICSHKWNIEVLMGFFSCESLKKKGQRFRGRIREKENGNVILLAVFLNWGLLCVKL